jgi:hypothetical protein
MATGIMIGIMDGISSSSTASPPRGGAEFIITQGGDNVITEGGDNMIAESLLCKSFDLDGVNEYGIYPNPLPGNNNFLFNNNQSFSLSIWFKLDSFFSTQTPLMGLGNTSVQLGYFITTINSSQKIRFNIVSGIFTTVTGQFFIDSFDTINLNEWVNVICTFILMELTTEQQELQQEQG